MILLSVDPFHQYDRLTRIEELILYECIFSTTFQIFLILLLVWTGLYSAFNIDDFEDGSYNQIEEDKSVCQKYKYKIIHTVYNISFNSDRPYYSSFHLSFTVLFLIY